jgi:outer membrane protein OmpA-like peptidoglycan-associated protein
LSFVFRATLPTGDSTALRGERRWTATPSFVLGLLTDRRGESLLSLSLGYRLRPRELPPGLAFELDDELDAGVALSLPALTWLRVLAEVRLRAGVGGQSLRGNEVPLELDLGARARLSPALWLFAGVGSGVWPERDAYGAPDYRVLAGVRAGLSPAGCVDGICTELDRDGDGVPDAVDGCPLAPEDRDGFADRDGCPDRDNDADGIDDAQDACPGKTEDRDGFEDEDGCPEPDNDADGLIDGADVCAMDPEDADGFEDEDGCPEPGPAPARIAVIEGRILVSERVFFEFERDTIRAVSMPLLDQLAGVIRDLPEDTRVQIEGHTDDSGNAAYNLDLSYRRAAAVVAYLCARGVSPAAVQAVGHGARHPVADNDSPEGRALNRRVEFTLHKR